MNFIIDDIGTVVQQMINYLPKNFAAINYLAGHEKEVTNRLQIQQQNPATKNLRYPLVVLFLDTEQPIIGDMIQYKLNLVIVMKTDPNDDVVERYQDSKPFKSVLYPMYIAFFKALSDSGLFTYPQVADLPKHTKIDRPFWGVEKRNERGTQQNTANIFNDYLDAIQIKNLEVNQKLKNC